MDKKEFIRKKYFLKRKNNYFEIDKNFFKPLISCIKKRVKSKQKNICLYYLLIFHDPLLEEVS